MPRLITSCLYCDRVAMARGLCGLHWNRWMKRLPMDLPKDYHKRKDGWIMNGYHWITTKDGRYVLEHREIMEQHLGRKLGVDECVHHKDHNKLNNALENLEVIDRAQHTHLHQFEGGRRRKATCPECGKPFQRLSWKPNQTCSKHCGLKRAWRDTNNFVSLREAR